MVANHDLNSAMKAIELALGKLPLADERVRVLATDLGNIHAFVGSDQFQDLGPGERQENVWAHLRQNVDAKALKFLYRVEPMNVNEFSEFIRKVQLHALSPDGNVSAE